MSEQPPQYPYPYQPPAPRRRGIGKPLAIGCGAGLLVFIVGIAILIAASNSGGNNSTPTGTTGAAVQATQTITQAPGHWTTTHTFTGNGTKKTEVFTVPNDWKIIWKCDPTSFYGGQYNLIVGVTASDGTSVDPAAINTICKAGNTGDSTEEYQSGQVYLDINSEGSWTIQVQELK